MQLLFAMLISAIIIAFAVISVIITVSAIIFIALLFCVISPLESSPNKIIFLAVNFPIMLLQKFKFSQTCINSSSSEFNQSIWSHDISTLTGVFFNRIFPLLSCHSLTTKSKLFTFIFISYQGLVLQNLLYYNTYIFDQLLILHSQRFW